MKRWPTEPVQPKTPVVMLEFKDDGGVISAELEESIGAREHTALLCRKIGSHCELLGTRIIVVVAAVKSRRLGGEGKFI